MKIQWWSLTAAVLALAVARQAVFAQGRTPQSAPASAPNALSAPYVLPPSQTPGPVAPPDAFAAPTASTWGSCGPTCPNDKPRFFTPFMLGDFVGPVSNQFSDVKVAEGESPRPTDRVFYKFNYFNNLDKPTWANPLQPIHNVDLYRNVFGMEKTFFDGAVSLEVRVPFYTLDAQAKDFRLGVNPAAGGLLGPVPGGPGIDDTEFGNLSAVGKAVLWEDKQTGSLISAGATLSFPTSSSRLINPGQSTLVYLQPFGAFILSDGDFFVQGFTSVTLPVARAESIVLFTDLGVGYYVYRTDSQSSLLTAVAPTLELHVADPLRQADVAVNDFGLFDGLKLHNVVDVTLGSTFEFANRATLGTGFVVPLTGPKPFDFEIIAQLNYRF